MKTMRRALRAGMTAILLSAAAPAWAQDAGPAVPISPERDNGEDREEKGHEPGKGFYANGYHFLPSANLSTFFNSNIFRTSAQDSPDSVTTLTGAMVGRFGGALSAVRQGGPTQNKLAFTAGLGYSQFLSSDQTVRALSGLEGTLGVSYMSQPKGKTSFVFNDSYQRSVIPRTIRAGEQLLPTFNENTNRLILGARMRPKGGALEQQIAYSGQLNFFEGAEFATANHWNHEVNSYTKWNFLPRTAALFAVSVGYNDFFRDANRDPLGNLDSVPVRATIGGLGLVGSRIQFSANVGYGNSFHRATGALAGTSRDVSFSGIIGQVSASVNLADRNVLSAGFEHNFATSLFGNFVTRDALSASLTHSFSSRLQASGALKVSVDRFSDIPPLDGLQPIQAARLDVPLLVNADVTYLARADLKVGGFVGLVSNISNFQTRDLNNGGINAAGFFQAQLGVQASYAY